MSGWIIRRTTDLVSVTWARDGVRKPPIALVKNVKYSLHFNAETIELDKKPETAYDGSHSMSVCNLF